MLLCFCPSTNMLLCFCPSTNVLLCFCPSTNVLLCFCPSTNVLLYFCPSTNVLLCFCPSTNVLLCFCPSTNVLLCFCPSTNVLLCFCPSVLLPFNQRVAVLQPTSCVTCISHDFNTKRFILYRLNFCLFVLASVGKHYSYNVDLQCNKLCGLSRISLGIMHWGNDSGNATKTFLEVVLLEVMRLHPIQPLIVGVADLYLSILCRVLVIRANARHCSA